MPKKIKSKAKKNLSPLFLLSLVILILVLLYLFFLEKPKANFDEHSPQFPQKANHYDLKEMWGQPAKGMYPHLTNPKYLTAKEAGNFLKDEDEIILVVTKNGFKAYPNFIIGFHHVVNEMFDNIPVAITYCCQTDNASVYLRKIDGQILTLAALGPLYYGNKVLYDLETDSYFMQFTGEAFYGPLKGKRLATERLVDRTTWNHIRNLNNLSVLAPVNSISFYRDWYTRMKIEGAGLFALKQKKKPDERLPFYTKGLGISINNESKYYPLDEIAQKKVINDLVGGWHIVVIFDPRFNSAKIFRRFSGNKTLVFELKNGQLNDRETNSSWNYDGSSYNGSQIGIKLTQPIYSQSYWYAWAAFYPKTEIYHAQK